MVAASWFSLMLLAVLVTGLAVAGLALTVVSRYTRAIGIVLLSILGMALLVGAALVAMFTVKRQTAYEDVEIRPPMMLPAERELQPISREYEVRLAAAAEPVAARDAGESEVPAAADEESLRRARSNLAALKQAVLRGMAASDEAAPTADDEPVEAPDPSDGSVAEDASGASGDGVETSPTAAAVDVPDALISHSDPLEPERSDVAELERYLESAGPTSDSSATSADGSSSAAEISPPGRPPWVDVPAFTIDQVDYIPVTSGPCATRGECRRTLADAMSRAVAEYVDDHRGTDGSAGQIRFEPVYLRTQLRHGGVYEETVQASFGPMIQQHALLKLDKSFREEIDRRWNQVKVTSRLTQVTLVALGALLGLAVVFSYLRLDTSTKGYYSRRLQVAAGAVILGLVAMGVLLARWIPWL